MSRAAAAALLLLPGCNASFIAAVAQETGGGSESGGSGELPAATQDGTGTDGTDGVSTDAPGCQPPEPFEGCDAAADPLRAPEFQCYVDVAAARFESADPDAWRRAAEFGNANWAATETDAVLVLSTGLLPEPGPQGEVWLAPSAAEMSAADNGNPDGAALPGTMVATPASATPFVDCDGVGDCSGTLATAFGDRANDLVWLTFDVTAPSGARGYALRVGFLSAAYPEDLSADVSDLFVWWHESADFVGNLATWQGAPATVAGLGPRMHEFSGEHPLLLRTGMDGTTGEPCDVDGQSVDCPIGAATGWMELRGPAEPGETIHIVAALLDQSAQPRDTVVVLDGFEWTCETCEAGLDCGLR